ncbi:hypothetical protein AB0425_14760 [Actinosynnema sp. NPDC051121]|nr:hypothetical protein [Saccharothrix sp.]
MTRRRRVEPPGDEAVVSSRARWLGIALMFASAVAIAAVAYAVGSANGAGEAARAIVAEQSARSAPGEFDYPEITEEAPAPVEEAPVEQVPVEQDAVRQEPVEQEPVEESLPVDVAPVVGMAESVEVPAGPEFAVGQVDVAAIVAETVAATVAELDASAQAAAEEVVPPVEPVVEPVADQVRTLLAPMEAAPAEQEWQTADAAEPDAVEPYAMVPGEVVEPAQVETSTVPGSPDFAHFAAGEAYVEPASPTGYVTADGVTSGLVRAEPGASERFRDPVALATAIHTADQGVLAVPAGDVAHVGW